MRIGQRRSLAWSEASDILRYILRYKLAPNTSRVPHGRRRAERRGLRALRARAGRGGGAGAAALRAGGPSGARRELRAELQVRPDFLPSC